MSIVRPWRLVRRRQLARGQKLHRLIMAGDRAAPGLRAEDVQPADGALVTLAELVRHHFFSTGLPQQVIFASAPFVTMNSDLQLVQTNFEPVATVGIPSLECDS